MEAMSASAAARALPTPSSVASLAHSTMLSRTALARAFSAQVSSWKV
jgi:hypothetical protein